MASYPPPTETLPIFDAGVFTTNDSTLTISQADARYLKFPVGQGTETIPNLVVSGTATAPTFIGALTGNADTATRATNIAGGLGGSIPYQTAVNTSALLPNGTSGQVLTSQGTTLAPVWASAGASNLSAVLTAGNTATNSIALNNTGTGANVISLLPNFGATDPRITITDGTTTNTIDKNGYTTRNSVQNATHYLNFSDSSTTGTGSIQKTANITCNPSTNKITATSLEATTSATISDQTIKQNSTNTIFNKTSSVTPSGSSNAFYGLESGLQTTTGGTNSAFGHNDTLKALTTGSSNSAFGSGASKTLISGSFNTAVGYNSAFLATQSNNTCLGARSGYNLTTGANNTFVGFGTETGTHSTGSNCTSLGYLANCANFASSTAIGANATNTATNQIVLGTANEDVVMLKTATINNETIKVDANNTIFNKTTSTNPSGASNAFYGLESGIATTTGGTNAGFGHNDTLKALTTGSSNSAFGSGSLKTLISGSSNTAVGYNSANAVNTGTGTTAIGALTAQTLTTGADNTFLGYGASQSNLTTGSQNTFLGATTGTSINCSNSTAVGSGATITANNQVVLGNSSVTAVVVPQQIQLLYSTLPTFTTTAIGYIYNVSLPTGTQGPGVGTYTQSVPKGIYLVFAYVEVNTNQSNTFYYEILVAGARQALSMCPPFSGATYNYLTAISTPASCSAASTNISLQVNYVNATILGGGSNFKIVRIA
jgi:hypothetical protein